MPEEYNDQIYVADNEDEVICVIMGDDEKLIERAKQLHPQQTRDITEAVRKHRENSQ